MSSVSVHTVDCSGTVRCRYNKLSDGSTILSSVMEQHSIMYLKPVPFPEKALHGRQLIPALLLPPGENDYSEVGQPV